MKKVKEYIEKNLAPKIYLGSPTSSSISVVEKNGEILVKEVVTARGPFRNQNARYYGITADVMSTIEANIDKELWLCGSTQMVELSEGGL